MFWSPLYVNKMMICWATFPPKAPDSLSRLVAELAMICLTSCDSMIENTHRQLVELDVDISMHGCWDKSIVMEHLYIY